MLKVEINHEHLAKSLLKMKPHYCRQRLKASFIYDALMFDVFSIRLNFLSALRFIQNATQCSIVQYVPIECCAVRKTS